MFLRQLLLLLVLFTTSHIGFAQSAKAKPQTPSPEKILVIKDLLTITGSTNLSNQIMANMMQSMKPAFPDVPEEVWGRLLKKMNAEEMVDSMVEIYDRHFSMKDLQTIVAFYKTEAGRRMIKELPSVMSEAMAVGQQWGRKKSAELLEELKAEQNAKQKSSTH